jgi:redox-sensing transcriptional repressor
MNLPPRTIERLSKYRRLLENYPKTSGFFIYSHHLARMLNLTPVQVRRDLMLIGLPGNHRKGYNISELIKVIGEIIDSEQGHNIAIVGMGNLGRAVARFISKNKTRMNMVAGFDIDHEKLAGKVENLKCYHIDEIREQIIRLGVDIIILTTSPEAAQGIANAVIDAGVKGILNFTSVHLDIPDGIYLKDYNITTSLEEIGFFIKHPIK